MAEVKGVTLSDILVDTESAKSLDRPAMARLLALVDARQVATIIIAKLDRLTRSVGDLADLVDRFEHRGVALVSVAESLDTRSSAGRLVVHILGSVAQWEREAIGERTRDALQHKRANGERVGTLPIGFRLVVGETKRLEPAPIEQRLLATIQQLHAACLSTRKIAAELNAHGWTTRRGTPWRHEYVAHHLRKIAG